MGDKPGMDLLVKVRNFLDGRSTLPRLILIIGFESGLKINFHWVGGWVAGSNGNKANLSFNWSWS